MKIKIFAALALLVAAGSAMAFVAGWNTDVVSSQAASSLNLSESYFMFSQIEMVLLWLVGLIGLGFARKRFQA